MGLADLTSQAVLAAIQEYDQLGKKAFLEKYGFSRSQAYWLAHDGQLYDSKAIAGAAHGHLAGQSSLSAGDFSGGAATVRRKLSELDFQVVHFPPEWTYPELLQALKLYVDAGALGGQPIPGRTDPRLVQLSETLRRQAAADGAPIPADFRSLGSVSQKLANLRSSEREVAIDYGVKGAEYWPAGSSHTSRADRAIIERFWDRWDSIDAELASERLRGQDDGIATAAQPQVFVLTWNPELLNLDLDSDRWQLARAGSLPDRWSIGARKSGIAHGDILFLFRVGEDAGLIRRGIATSQAFAEPHWEKSRAAAGQLASYVRVAWSEQPSSNQPLTRDTLNTAVPEVNWSRLQGSGVKLNEDVAAKVLSLWDDHLTQSDAEPPENVSPEVSGAIDLADQAAGRPPRRSNRQGMGLTAAQRRTVELHAMDRAEELLTSTWKVKDVSSNHSYDLHCTNADGELHVEVKGTTSGPEEVILTVKEVEHHRDHSPASALVIVHSIKWSNPERSAVHGGELLVFDPWTIDEQSLRPISYRYRTPSL